VSHQLARKRKNQGQTLSSRSGSNTVAFLFWTKQVVPKIGQVDRTKVVCIFSHPFSVEVAKPQQGKHSNLGNANGNDIPNAQSC
jgi:hypothetical protein